MYHYDMYQMILYPMEIDNITCTLLILIPFIVYVCLFVIYDMCIHIFINRERTSDDTRKRQYFTTDIS